MNATELQAKYDELKDEGTRLAGDLLDIPRRVVALHQLYRESRGNHAFSLIAAHGALWAAGYFEAGGSLGRLIGQRYFYNRQERAYRLGLLQEFAEAFRRVNRQVCIDSYANFHFARQFGQQSAAGDVLPASLLDALNRVHQAAAQGKSLDPREKRAVFEQSFLCEQEITVAPGVQRAVSGFDCRIMRWLCLRPLVRFSFFPRWRYLWFRDFSSQQERIEKGLQAYDLAAAAGWDQVHDSLRKYRCTPETLFQSPGAGAIQA